MTKLIFRNVSASPDDPVSEWPQEAMERIVSRAREAAEASERQAVAAEVAGLVDASSLTRGDFVSRIGTSASRLSTYATGRVKPSAALLVRMRAVGGPPISSTTSPRMIRVSSGDGLTLENRSVTKLPCPWCGQSLRESVSLSGRVRCAQCGVAITYPWPSDEELDAAYAGWYRPTDGRFSGIGDKIFLFLRGCLAKRLDRIAPDGPVLDVGSGVGALLTALRRRGRAAVGLERGSPEEEGVEILDVTEKGWAAIVFWHSLEHLREPGKALEHASRLLSDDGVLIVAMPNAASLQARLFGDRWLALDLPRHLVHVPAHNLLQKLRDSGLSVERVSYSRGGQVLFGWSHGIVGALPGQLNLYDAIRRPDARSAPISSNRRLAALAAAIVTLPLAMAGTVVEVVMRQSGVVYVEARRA